jgi:teichuronic acid biosynthesis glycosyltransferase TuaG
MPVSIILPVFNSEAFIAETIESVMKQTYKEFELIIIDDCSSDETINIITSYSQIDSRIKVIRLNKNNGCPAAPRNIGVRSSVYSLISFIDSDDIWHPQKLEKQIEIIDKYPDVNFVSTEIINFKNNFTIKWPKKRNKDKLIRFKTLLFKFRTPTSSVLVSKSLFDVQYFNENKKYKAREDLDLWLKFHENIKYSYKLGIKLVAYRLSDNQISGNKLEMIKRHYNVLFNYKFKNKFKISYIAIILTSSHFIIAFFDRFFKRSV